MGTTFNLTRPSGGVYVGAVPITSDCDHCDPCTGAAQEQTCSLPYKSRATMRVACPGSEVPAVFVNPNECPPSCEAPEIDFSKVQDQPLCYQDQSRAAYFGPWYETEPGLGDRAVVFATPNAFSAIGRGRTLEEREVSAAALYAGFEGDNTLSVTRGTNLFNPRLSLLAGQSWRGVGYEIDEDKEINPYFDRRIPGTSCVPCPDPAGDPECQELKAPCFVQGCE